MTDFKKFNPLNVSSKFAICGLPIRVDTYKTCNFSCSYCLDGETLINMYDGTTKQLKELNIGDEIYGVTEDENGRYEYCKSTVLNKWTTEKPSYKIILEDGRELICSSDHRWLTDRGWKYTTSEHKIRPYLTNKLYLRGLSGAIDSSNYDETDDYKKGYLSGMIIGDGNLGIYVYEYDEDSPSHDGVAYRFRLALKDQEGVERTKKYLEHFGVYTHDFDFPITDRKTKETIHTKAIRTSNKDNYYKISKLIKIKNEYLDNAEWLRGFLAGIYDAEGASDKYVFRLYNSDDTVMNTIQAGFKYFGFAYVFDKDVVSTNKVVHTIRVLGGLSEKIRFFQIAQPAILRKKNYCGHHVSENFKIKEIMPYKDKQLLYDITTSTENFIANGLISHNCFANCRKIMEFEKTLQVGNISLVEKKLDKIFNKNQFDNTNFLDKLIAEGYDWHCGGMSDPFQPIEGELHITEQLLDVTNKYGIHILFSTKGKTTYGADIRPDLHTFQLSVTNVDNRKDIEPNVPNIEERYKFYRELKDNGFKVGIRVQPFIPNISNLAIIEMFRDADHFTIEGLKLVPQNKEHKNYLLELTGLSASDFTQMGLLNLKPEIRAELYKPFIAKLQEYNIPYSIADNDMHHIGTSKCCCGDALIHKSTDFNNTSMIYKYGTEYTKEQLDTCLAECGVGNCKCNHLFTSNRQEGCVTVQDFYDKRFDRKSSPFSPKFLYRN